MSAEEQLQKLDLADGTAAAAGAAATAAGAAKPAKEKKAKAPKAEKPSKPAQGEGKKKETKLGLAVKKGEDFGEWYSHACVESEMISYYDVSGGCCRLHAGLGALVGC